MRPPAEPQLQVLQQQVILRQPLIQLEIISITVLLLCLDRVVELYLQTVPMLSLLMTLRSLLSR